MKMILDISNFNQVISGSVNENPLIIGLASLALEPRYLTTLVFEDDSLVGYSTSPDPIRIGEVQLEKANLSVFSFYLNDDIENYLLGTKYLGIYCHRMPEYLYRGPLLATLPEPNNLVTYTNLGDSVKFRPRRQ